jgi:hypothetical protein
MAVPKAAAALAKSGLSPTCEPQNTHKAPSLEEGGMKKTYIRHRVKVGNRAATACVPMRFFVLVLGQTLQPGSPSGSKELPKNNLSNPGLS